MKANWIKITPVTLPEEFRGVLITDGGNIACAKLVKTHSDGYFWAPHNFSGYDIEGDFGAPTHWAELPEPPRNGSELE